MGRVSRWLLLLALLGWEAILQTLGWLHLDRTLGMAAHVVGSGVMVSAVAAAGWITHLSGRETCDVMRI